MIALDHPVLVYVYIESSLVLQNCCPTKDSDGGGRLAVVLAKFSVKWTKSSKIFSPQFIVPLPGNNSCVSIEGTL